MSKLDEKPVLPAEAAEAALRETEDRYRFVTEALPIYVWYGAQGGYEYCNQRLLEFTGLTLEQIRAGENLKLIHPDDLGRLLAAARHSFATGEEYSQEYRIRRHDGVYCWHLAHSRRFVDHRGETKWLGVSVDITSRKLAEEALRRSETLATAGRMAATIAHEINNPLEAVTNIVYVAHSDPATPEHIRTMLLEADNELRHVAHIVRQVLGFYREDAPPSTVSLAELVQGVAQLYRRKIDARSLRFSAVIPSDLRTMVISGEIRQVIANLLANAIVAAPDGGEIKVSGRATEAGCELVVSDNGEGVPPHLVSRLFEPFFTTKTNVGTGLGLWVSHQIAQKHGGNLRYVRTKTGETSFVLELPRLEPGSEDPAPRARRPQL